VSQDLLATLLDAARAAGAEQADALLVRSASLAVQRRLGAIEQLERSEGVDLGLRVFLGNRMAIVSGTDASRAGFAALAERAVAMARVVPADSFATLLDAPAPTSALPARALTPPPAQAREEGADAAAALAAARAEVARAAAEAEALRADAAGLRGKRDVAEGAVLQLQAALVDATDVASQLHSEALEGGTALTALRAQLQARGGAAVSLCLSRADRAQCVR